LARMQDKKYGKLWVPFLLLLMFMLPAQLKALNSSQHALFEKNIAALALALGIKDQSQISIIHDDANHALSMAQIAAERNLCVFGMLPIKNARKRLGTQSGTLGPPTTVCLGHLDEVQKVPDDDRYLVVSGWIFNRTKQMVPDSLDLVDDQGRVVGIVLTGQPRPDVATAIDPAAAYSGFKGYLFANQQGKTVTLENAAAACQLTIQVPFYYRFSQGPLKEAEVTVSKENVLPGNEWLGSDFYKSSFDNLIVLGSFMHSDADTGEISLHVRRGDKLLYRSGPKSGHQFIEIMGSPHLPLPLPTALDWTQLEFSAQTLPDEFDVKFSDRGSGWGEWSAIAVRTR
jgi:hypothetical protein